MTEFLKTLLICVLTVTMVLLTVCFFIVTVSSDALSPRDLVFEATRSTRTESNEKDVSGTQLQTAAFPCQIAFFSGMGRLYMPLSHQEYSEALSSTEQFFEEAIGSCYDYRQSSETDYLLSLLEQGILWVYDYPMPFYMLSRWADYDYALQDISVSSMFACVKDSSVTLHLKDSAGAYHCFSTQADGAFITRTCATFSPNGVISAMTNSRNTADDVLILSGGFSLPCYSVNTGYSGDNTEISRTVMTRLRINPYLSSVYRDGDTTIYIEGSSRLHLYADRHLSYTVTDQSGGIPLSIPSDVSRQDSLLAMIEGVRAIVFGLWDDLSSDSVQLSLTSISENDGAYTLYFDAYIGGCYISRGDIAAAAALVENGKITSLSIYPLSLHRTKDSSVLPFAQAQAAASDKAVLRVQYVLGDENILVPILADVKGGN